MDITRTLKSNQSKKGFTLIELLVAIAILIIMLTIGVPSFANLIDSNKLKTTRDLLVTSIHSALQQASSKNVPVYLCPSADLGNSCDSQWNREDGWLLYEDIDRDAVLGAGEVFLIQNDIKIEQIQITGSALMKFTSTGHTTENTFYICSNLDAQDDLQFTISRSGRITYGISGALCD